MKKRIKDKETRLAIQYHEADSRDVILLYKCPVPRCKIHKANYPGGDAILTCQRHALPMRLEKIAVRTPRAIAFVENGVVHDVMSDMHMKLRIIDYDVEGSDNYKRIKLPGSGKGETQLAHVHKFNLEGVEDMEPFFKQKAIQ